MNEQNINDLLKSIEIYYEKSKGLAKKFGGPSIYFHQECIRAGKEDYLGDRHIEMLYATLTAWGMHRMGDIEKTKAKLVEFDEFKKTILGKKEELNLLKNIDLSDLGKHKNEIKDIFLNLKISISNALIVANSKVMYHLLWNLIPPIDREHTIRFFMLDKDKFKTKNGKMKTINIPSDLEKQFNLFWEIVVIVKQIAESKEFNSLKITSENKGFDSSKPKIVDDLIMTFVKEIKGM